MASAFGRGSWVCGGGGRVRVPSLWVRQIRRSGSSPVKFDVAYILELCKCEALAITAFFAPTAQMSALADNFIPIPHNGNYLPSSCK